MACLESPKALGGKKVSSRSGPTSAASAHPQAPGPATCPLGATFPFSHTHSPLLRPPSSCGPAPKTPGVHLQPWGDGTELGGWHLGGGPAGAECPSLSDFQCLDGCPGWVGESWVGGDPSSDSLSMPGLALGGGGGGRGELPLPSPTHPPLFLPFSVFSKELSFPAFLSGLSPNYFLPMPFSSLSVSLLPMTRGLTSVRPGDLGLGSALDPPSSSQPSQPWPSPSSPLRRILGAESLLHAEVEAQKQSGRRGSTDFIAMR